MGRRKGCESCPIDMTPMIDVVFQLIIFFIVTIKFEEQTNKDIRMEMAKNGPAIEEQDPRASEIEIDQRGWISMHGAQLTKQQLYNIIKSKFNRMGGRSFPILIRADYRTKHQDVRSVMDICTSIGIWRINFVAIKEKKTQT